MKISCLGDNQGCLYTGLMLDDIRELLLFFLGEIIEVIQENVHINWNCRLKYSGVKCMSPNTCNLLSNGSVKKIHIPRISGWWVKGCVLYSPFSFLVCFENLLKIEVGGRC